MHTKTVTISGERNGTWADLFHAFNRVPLNLPITIISVLITKRMGAREEEDDQSSRWLDWKISDKRQAPARAGLRNGGEYTATIKRISNIGNMWLDGLS